MILIGKNLTSSGDVSVFAFNISKMITSVFGGMLTFQDVKLAEKVSVRLVKPPSSKIIFFAVVTLEIERIPGDSLLSSLETISILDGLEEEVVKNLSLCIV